MNKIKHILCVIYEIIIVYYIYCVSVLMFKIGFKDISKQIFFICIGSFLTISLLKYYKIYRGVNCNETENLQKINNSIKKLKTYNKLDNAIIKINNLKEKLDCVIITPKGIFNIIKCNYKGDISIYDDFKWVCNNKKKSYLIKSPIHSIKHSRNVLKQIFKEYQIYDIVLIMNDRCNIVGDENSKVQILRYNDLGKYISNYQIQELYSIDELYDKLYPYLYSNEDCTKKIELYNKLLYLKWKYRGRLIVCITSILFFINVLIKT